MVRFRFSHLVSLVVLVLVGLPVQAQDKPEPTNLLTNGSFEEVNEKTKGPSGWYINPSWYVKSRKAEASDWTLDKVTLFNGQQSLRFDGKGGVCMAQQPVKGNYKKGQRFRLSARVKMKDLGPTHAYVTVELKDGKKWIDGFGGGKRFVKGESDWQLFSTEFVLPADGTYLTVMLRTQKANNGTVWFDNVELIRLDADEQPGENAEPDKPKVDEEARLDVPPPGGTLGLVPIEMFTGDEPAWNVGVWGRRPEEPIQATYGTVGKQPVVRLTLPGKGTWASRKWGFLDPARALCLRLRATRGNGKLVVLIRTSDRKAYTAWTPNLTSEWQDVVMPITSFEAERGKGNLDQTTHLAALVLVAQKAMTVEIAQLNAEVPPKLAVREVWSDADSGIMVPGTGPTVTASLYNSTETRQTARLAWRLRNYGGEVIARGGEEIVMPAGSLAEKSVTMPKLETGYYSCEVALERDRVVDHKWTGLVVLPERPDRAPVRPFIGLSHFGSRLDLSARLWMHRMQLAFREDNFNPARPDDPPSDYIADHLAVAKKCHMTTVAYLGMNPQPYHGGWALDKSTMKNKLRAFDLDKARTFAAAAARRYGDDIDAWMPASEANLCVKRIEGGKAHYRDAVRAVLEGIKSADPDARLLTMNVSGSDAYQGWVFTKYIYEEVKDLVHGVYGDTYPSGHMVKEGLVPSPPESHIRQHQRQLKSFIGPDMTTGLTETGYELDGYLPYWHELVRLRADFAARAPLVSASVPFVNEYMWFKLTRAAPSSTWGIMLTGGMHDNPDPAVATYATVARMMYDAGLPTTVSLHEQIESTVYPLPDGAMAVLYTTAADPISFAFRGLSQASVTEVDGSLGKADRGTIFLTGSPTYVRVKGLTVEQLTERLKQADYSLPPVKLAFQLVDSATLRLWIKNQTADQNLTGAATLTVELPGGALRKAVTDPMTIKPGELARRDVTVLLGKIGTSQTFRIRGSFTTQDNITTRADKTVTVHSVTRLEAPPVIDGKLDEYDNATRLELNRAEYVAPTDAVMPHKLWQSAADLSCTARTAWDDKHLYLAFEVTDPEHVQRFTAGAIWKNDCVHLGFDMKNDTLNPQFTGKGGQDGANDYEVGLAKTPEGPQANMWASGPDKTNRGLLKSVKLAVVRRDGKTIYEAAIPWTELQPFRVAPGNAFGFSFVVMNSNDGGIAPYWLQLTGGICGGKDPSQYDVLLLRNKGLND